MGFLSTPSARRATPLIKSVIWAVVFLSTPSARRATLHPIYLNFPFQFLSTPSARRATAAYTDNIAVLFISIHALREEGDSLKCWQAKTRSYFYPRPPRGGRPYSYSFRVLVCNFYPRPPRGGRQKTARFYVAGDQFLSTPSARRATHTRVTLVLPTPDFYPRPPRGGRPNYPAFRLRYFYFYPRPPRGGRLANIAKQRVDFLISIHALREEGDTTQNVTLTWYSDFYPRPPRGGRLQDFTEAPHTLAISIHALREEGDQVLRARGHLSKGISIHALREEGDAATTTSWPPT